MAENLHTDRNDSFARESFTWRRMKNWQLWSITVAAVVILIAMLVAFA